ncbi:pilin [Rhodanobacter lindaniclasticus]
MVAIIAILAAIAIPAYQDYLVRTQVSEGAVLADGAKTAVAEFYSNTGKLSSGGNASVGLATPASINGKYVTSVTVSATGLITVPYGGPKASTEIPIGATLAFPRHERWQHQLGLPGWQHRSEVEVPAHFLPLILGTVDDIGCVSRPFFLHSD